MASATPEPTYLEADPEIRAQKFVCLSFLTPKPEFIREKRFFFVSEFLKGYAFDYKVKATEGFIADQYRQMQSNLSDIEMDFRNLDPATITMETLKKFCDRISEKRGAISRQSVTDLGDFVKANLPEFRESDIVEAYEKFMLLNRQRLEDKFHEQKSFQTTMLGLKVRGSFATREEANAYAKRLNKNDPSFNIYVADVGQWLPWDPSPEEIADQEYPTDTPEGEELNKLMKAYRENAAKATELFESEKALAIEKARQELEAAKLKQQQQGMFRCKSGGCKGSKYKKPSESEKAAKAKADTLLEEILAKRREDEDAWLRRGREWNPSDQTKPSPVSPRN